MDQSSCVALMLLLLHSRNEPNISKSQLSFIEESVDLNEFDGLFTNPTVKKIVNSTVKHFATAIKKKKIKQNEAYSLLTGAVINFKCSDVETKVIKQCLIDSITHAIAKQS